MYFTYRLICIFCRMHYVVCSMHYAVCTMQFAVCTMQYVLCNVHYVVCSVKYTVCTMQCEVCSVHYALCFVQCAFERKLILPYFLFYQSVIRFITNCMTKVSKKIPKHSQGLPSRLEHYQFLFWAMQNQNKFCKQRCVQWDNCIWYVTHFFIDKKMYKDFWLWTSFKRQN